MKYITMLMFSSLTIFALCQNTVYMNKGKKEKKVQESVRLDLKASAIPINQGSAFDVANVTGVKSLQAEKIIEITEKILSFGYKLTTDILESRLKKFSGEYEKENSYLRFSTGMLPEAHFVREARTGNATYDALSFKLTPKKAGLNYFYYSVSEFKLLASKAKSTGKSSVFDYSIELNLTYIQDTVAHEVTLPPVQIHSVGYNVNPLSSADPDRYRTELIPIPKDAFIVKVGVKVIETNPQKVSAQKFLDLWNNTPDEYKDHYEEIKALLIKSNDEAQ